MNDTEGKIAKGYPLKTFDALYHVGEMNPGEKKSATGLPVTTEPDAWKRMWKLSGSLYELTKENHAFLDFYRLTKKEKKEIEKWGLEQGYLKITDVYRVSWYDDEYDRNVTLDFTNKEDAEKETLECGYSARVREVKKYETTAKMDAKVQYPSLSPSIAIELLTTLFADEVLHIDGVWWDKNLNIIQLSAPEGSICPSKIPEWSKHLVG
ncbi:hypothetical protein PP175_25305 (plasmid) [Aneurinibacillus sp. Ricciae_BoGa-3]|uniref:hypothetical protein n=1 Tax=Aneurinibacillus sp. Ricciae_BoGa-3 TaxID=3022697 RepID=UPI00234242DB|nr:hypothetical protein [Aneurinibacillus sp. Ricciae_BoGa-3]WCK57387.1 hypothetical protein PP175_25305 [Aneurinibacillus sp. Ricciae_BoGa-3]